MLTVIGSLKGGTGKSTVTFNLGVWLASVGRPVVVFDLDPQRTVSDVSKVRTQQGYLPRFQLIDANDQLARKLDVLQRVRREIVIDIGTADLASMGQAIARADRVLIPVGPSQADVWSTQRFMHLIREACREREPERLAFINRADRIGDDTEDAERALGSIAGLTCLPHRLYYRTAYRTSLSEGLAVFELAPGGEAAREFIDLAEALYPSR